MTEPKKLVTLGKNAIFSILLPIFEAFGPLSLAVSHKRSQTCGGRLPYPDLYGVEQLEAGPVGGVMSPPGHEEHVRHGHGVQAVNLEPDLKKGLHGRQQSQEIKARLEKKLRLFSTLKQNSGTCNFDPGYGLQQSQKVNTLRKNNLRLLFNFETQSRYFVWLCNFGSWPILDF